MVTEAQREQIEREETLRNDLDVKRQQEQQSNTMHGRAVAEASLDTGRYSVAMGKPTVVGAEPAVKYPPLPSSSPWSGAQPEPGIVLH
jgi:hypothetical protein